MTIKSYPKQKTVRLSSAKYKELKSDVHKRDNWTCINQNCPCKTDPHLPPINYVLDAHHNIPRGKPPGDVAWNMATLCRKCHTAVTDRKIDDFFVGEYLNGIYGGDK